jgi:Flp pilus assembly protein CpaB
VLRARLRRRPVAWWLLTLVLAGVTGQVVSSAVGRAEQGSARFGAARPVLVVTAELAAGAVLTDADAELRSLPVALVPDASVGAEALGSRVRSPLFPGEVVRRERLAPAGMSAVAALLPPGTRGVAVARGEDVPPLEVGDVVDVLATVGAVAPEEASGAPTVTVTSGAVVVATGEAAVTIAVPLDDTARVAYAAAIGVVTLALVGG